MSEVRELPYNPQRLFVASCVALITTAMTFSIRSDILSAFGAEFQLTHQQEGYITQLGLWGFPIAIMLVGPLCDSIGMGLLLKLAAVGHVLGVVGVILSPSVGFPMLLAANLLLGLANGTVEAVINPLAATVYADQKTHRLNVLHAFWPGGLIIGGLLAFAITKIMGVDLPNPDPATLSLSWKLKMATIIVGAVAYLVLIAGQRFPATERVQSGVSTGDMFRAALAPGFLLLTFCMCLTAITELGPDQWVGSVLTKTVGIQGVLFLVYTSGLMFLLRFFAGPLAHRLSPFGLLLGAAALSAVGLFLLSGSTTAGAAFVAATVFGLGKAYFWPTMLGVAAERYPRTGALGLALMGAAGMIAAGAAGPTMGGIYDRGTVSALPAPVAQVVVVDGKLDAERVKAAPTETQQAVEAAGKQGAALAFKSVAVLPLVLVLLFAALYISTRRGGGYQAVKLEADEGSPPS
ncbi:MAG: MFS transporter [Fimbriimonadaceae bacterium]|nr:MFS transporter [Fimbriimonadaceae bacterium]